MRVVHLTDLHVQCAPRFADLWGKRLIGSANLYLFGRQSHFTAAAQAAAVEAACALKPDAVVITGDISAQALDSEFEQARALLEPLIQLAPTVVIAGNHDTYVREDAPGARLRRWFGDCMGAEAPSLRRIGDVAFLHIETCRTALLSSGHCDPDQLPRATELLQDADDCFVFLCQHYPLRGRDGEPYGPSTRNLSNAAELEAWIGDNDAVDAILHGHEHHGFRGALTAGGRTVPILDPGASGYAFLPDQRRTAHFNVYDVDGGGLHAVDRYSFDGERFVAEAGGAYATGR